MDATEHKEDGGGEPDALARAEVLLAEGRADEAVAVVQRLAETHPRRDDLKLVLATVLRRTGRYDRAERHLTELTSRRASEPVFRELGIVCEKAGRPFAAERHLRRAIEAASPGQGPHRRWADMLLWTGKVSEAVSELRRIVERHPDNAAAHSHLLMALHYRDQLAPGELAAEHRRWADRHAPPALQQREHDNDSEPARPLRIGLLSPDLRRHSVAAFVEPILDGRDPAALRIYGYGSVATPDDVTRRLAGKMDHYRGVFSVSDDELAGQIREDRIDVLIDLAGHTAGNRLPVLARKPAPVQASYLGYPDTTGIEAVDLFLTDERAAPAELRDCFAEEIVHLPAGGWVYRPPQQAPPVGPPPSSRGEPPTFGSFNINRKLTRPTLDLWARTLQAVPDARLLLKFYGGDEPEMREMYLEAFEARGVEPGRVEILGRRGFVDHLRLYERVDVALDPWPYNGTTTTCEALWMGVPAITLRGDRPASRVGHSLLRRAGLDVCVASTPDELAQRAAALATRAGALAKLRASMRDRLRTAGLTDGRRFAAGLESALREAWSRWCDSRR